MDQEKSAKRMDHARNAQITISLVLPEKTKENASRLPVKTEFFRRMDPANSVPVVKHSMRIKLNV